MLNPCCVFENGAVLCVVVSEAKIEVLVVEGCNGPVVHSQIQHLVRYNRAVLPILKMVLWNSFIVN